MTLPNLTICKFDEVMEHHKKISMTKNWSLIIIKESTQEVEEEREKLWKITYHLDGGKVKDDTEQQEPIKLDTDDIIDIVNEVIDNISQMVKRTYEERVEIRDIIKNDLDESVNKDQDVMDNTKKLSSLSLYML